MGRKFPEGGRKVRKRAEGKGTEAPLLEKETIRDGAEEKEEPFENSGDVPETTLHPYADPPRNSARVTI